MERITNLLGVQRTQPEFSLWRTSFARSCGGLAETNEKEGSRITAIHESDDHLKSLLLKHDSEIVSERTKRRQTEESLKSSEGFTKALMSILPDPVLRLRKDGAILDFKIPSSMAMPGSCKIIGKNIQDFLPKHIAEQAVFHVEKALLENQPQQFRFHFPIDSKIREWEARLVAYSANEVLVIVRDTTGYGHVEKEIIEVCERERERIGQDLHDSLGQHLSGIKFLCTALSQKAARSEAINPDDAAYIEGQVNVALQQARSLARGLYIVDLEEKGLPGALNQLARRMEKLDVTCHVSCADTASIVDMPTSKHLYHIAQEAVNNAIRHGQAQNIWIELLIERNHLTLRIKDDGIGFPKGNSRKDGIGLQIMKCRAHSIGATLLLQREQKGGSSIVCSLETTSNEHFKAKV